MNPILNECQARDPDNTGFLTFQEFRAAILTILPLNDDEFRFVVRHVEVDKGEVKYETAVAALDIE